jgi:O-antigen/teichoic acid export membrane protein
MTELRPNLTARARPAPPPMPAPAGVRMLAWLLRDRGLVARVMRSSAWTIFGYGASQAVRLASNLVLTRLLFPEAFGMMALVTVALVGLQQFSDMGTGPAIMQNRRGDDPGFLDTAWTLQAIRGLALWLGTCALALPVARFYHEPELARLLPVAGLSLLIAGFNPTRIETANRHLMLGRVTLLDLASQVVGIVAMVGLAWATRSIWSLVLGTVVGAAARLALTHAFLPGPSNRFRWEREAAGELVHFGKWIFLSTVCGFVIAQGDRVILGKYLTLELLGIYNIGYFLASFPLLLGGAVTGRVLIPLYRESPPAASPENFRKLRLMRLALTGGVAAMLLAMAWLGPWLVNVLYDLRFAAAGPVVTLIACMQLPQVVGMTYDLAALAAGDSRRFFLVLAPRAAIMTAFLLIGAEAGGLVGALLGQGLAMVLAYPLIVALARRYRAWDPLHDAIFAAAGIAFGLALWAHRDAIAALAAL